MACLIKTYVTILTWAAHWYVHSLDLVYPLYERVGNIERKAAQDAQLREMPCREQFLVVTFHFIVVENHRCENCWIYKKTSMQYFW